jgi:hypothetical protein
MVFTKLGKKQNGSTNCSRIGIITKSNLQQKNYARKVFWKNEAILQAGIGKLLNDGSEAVKILNS